MAWLRMGGKLDAHIDPGFSTSESPNASFFKDRYSGPVGSVQVSK